MASQVFGMIILWIVGLFILYLVIFKAVKDGINRSVVGQSLEKDSDQGGSKKSWLDDDLDN
ncbi:MULTISPECIES: hypothetical protein [unclassified Sporosarcina]|uniref:hypothetical protein n=1 Tax=unclassified Sporosarcina TaxID=2647733 RepID=UPI000C1718EE|nr:MULTISPECIES: hypothetical protein [unclassified Sporosarcina]PID04824.1 hypothetical protein CSV66_13230 [Sporosarcina sp. P30]PID07979.1 hypothetical protein CSV65_13430 [Sporosarcina sp. P31]PID11165.1 hypothetical protein CSV64_13460 [Sporosarcina sp. P32b]